MVGLYLVTLTAELLVTYRRRYQREDKSHIPQCNAFNCIIKLIWWPTGATASHFKITQFLHKNSSAPCIGSSFLNK